METLLKYAKQPSTWRGLIAVLTGLGVAISPELAEALIVAGVSAIGVVEVVRNEPEAK